MSDPEQSPVPPLSEVQELGSGPRAAEECEQAHSAAAAPTSAPPSSEPAPPSEPAQISEPAPPSEPAQISKPAPPSEPAQISDSAPPSESAPPSDEVPRKRSSIRPAPIGWRPSEAHLRPASPMVVVYSGDSDRPAPNWQAEPTPRGPVVQTSGQYETGPFLPVKEVRREKLASGPGLFDALSEEVPPPPAVEVVAGVGTEREREAEREREPEPTFVAAVQSVGGSVASAAPTTGEDGSSALDPRTRPTVRVGRASQRPPSIVPGPPASLSVAKALAARRSLTPSLPPAPAKPTGVPRGILLGLLSVAACLGLFLVQRARSRAETESKPAPPAAVVESSRVARSPAAPAPRAAPAAEAQAQAQAETAASPSALASPASPPPAPSAAPASASSVATRKVTLEVVPADSKVFTHGSLRKGPPFTFDIRPGARLIVEVVRPGYVARRVVLDGSKPELAVGLLRKRNPTPARARSEAATSSPKAAAEQRGTAVQSGL